MSLSRRGGGEVFERVYSKFESYIEKIESYIEKIESGIEKGKKKQTF